MYLRELRHKIVLVTFTYNDQHLNVNHHKSKKLPDFTCSHFTCKCPGIIVKLNWSFFPKFTSSCFIVFSLKLLFYAGLIQG